AAPRAPPPRREDPRAGRRATRSRLQPRPRDPSRDAGRAREGVGGDGPRAVRALVTMRADAVLLLAFGGPTRPDEIRPFLDNVTRGRRIPPERLQRGVPHYTQR